MQSDVLISSIIVVLIKSTPNLSLWVKQNLGQVRFLGSPALGKLTPNLPLWVKQNLNQV